jgi:hypothetical protein
VFCSKEVEDALLLHLPSPELQTLGRFLFKFILESRTTPYKPF